MTAAPRRSAQFGALVRDALLELRARRLFWVAVFLAVGMIGAESLFLGANSSMTVAINGHVRTARGAANVAAVVLPGFTQFLCLAVAMITLFGLNGVITSVTERGTAEVYVSKPVPRALLFASRVAGYWIGAMVAVVAIEIALWLVAGLRAGAWSPRLFLSLPFIALVEAVYLTMLALFNVLTGAGGLSGLLAFVVYIVTDVLKNHEIIEQFFRSPVWRHTIEWSYRILPKPGEILGSLPGLQNGTGGVAWFAVWTTVLFVGAAWAAATWAFERKDY